MPRFEQHRKRSFRLPSTIGKSVQASLTRAVEQNSDPRFRERTLAWFRAGEDLRDELPLESRTVRFLRRALPILGVGALAVILLVLFV